MAETKEDIAAERDALREENEKLRAALASAAQSTTGAAGGVVAPAHRFQLSEGDRQELAMRGEVNIGGRMRTAAEVAGMLEPDQSGVDLGDAPKPPTATRIERGAVRGVDYVYPSVAPGQIDPAVAGQPGINGPSASTRPADAGGDPATRGE